MQPHATITSFDLDVALLKAQVKARLAGISERVQLGRFELLRRCGQGGEGVVYEAFDPTRRSRVALKHLHHAHAAAGASLRREFRALSDLVHPNLATLYELFCVEEQWFYTMELLSGVDFVSHVRARAQQVDEPALRAALVQLLRGLSAIHAAGKVHRDLKPRNVLIEPDGRVVILDYGLVIDGNDPERTRPAGGGQPPPGTAAYMAPEQARNQRVDSAADLYAVGAMLFEALCGSRAPAAGREPCGAAPRPSLVARAVAPDLDALCADLLAHDAQRRPTADQALTRLHALPACVQSTRADSGLAARASPGAVARELFVGRRAQLCALHAAFEAAHAGTAQVVLLHGESGIGKSTLLRRFCAELDAGSDALVLHGCCYEREHTAYKVFEGTVEGLVRYLSALPSAEAAALLPAQLPALARVFPAFLRLEALRGAPHGEQDFDPNQLRNLAFGAARELLTRVAGRRVLVLSIDDLQWGDLDSVRLLQRILAPPDPPALLLVGAYRSDELHSSPFLRQALVQGGLSAAACCVTELALEPLAPEEAAELMRGRAGTRAALSQASVAARVRAARGLPFALLELSDCDPAEVLPAGTGATLDEVVRRRAARCTDAAHELLAVLCAAGRPLEVSLALAAAQLGTDAWPAAAELCAARLARWRDTDDDRCLETYHGLVREAICSRHSGERARGLHAAIARQMESLGIDQPEPLVEHLIAAGERERAGLAAARAAERARQKLAWNRAAELFALAVSLLPHAQADAQGLHERLAEVSAFAGLHPEAAAAYLRGAQLQRGRAAARLERLAARQLMRAGQTEPAIALLKRLLRDVGLRYPQKMWRPMASYWLGRLRRRLAPSLYAPRRPRDQQSEERAATLAALYAELWLPDPVRACAIHTAFFSEAQRACDRYWVQALAWESIHLGLMHGKGVERRLTQLQTELDALTAASGNPYDLALAQVTRAASSVYCEFRARDALPLLHSAQRLLSEHCPGSHFERCWLGLVLDYVLEYTGHYAELIQTVHERERESSGRSDGYTSRQLLVSMPLVLMLQDRPQAALSFLRERWTRSTSTFTSLDLVGILRTSNALTYAGDPGAAQEYLLRQWWWMRRVGAMRSRAMRESALYTRARNALALYWQTRDPRQRREVQARTAHVERVLPVGRPFFRALQASLARADGDDARARRLLLLAGRDFETTQSEPGQCSVRLRLAQLDGDTKAAAAALGWLAERGVRAPATWVALGIPGPSDWQR